MTYYRKTMPSPVGTLQLVASGSGLAAVLWPDEDGSRVRLGPFVADAGHPLLAETQRQLDRYFAGTLRQFDLPLDFHGTAFQQRVWRLLLTIPWGETRSYGQIARELGVPAASRAVGAANGRNPVSIIAPCHRVVGATGKLTGFAGGLAAKEYLLRLEDGLPLRGSSRRA
jgi:methylated-DNA-[protein]-cysteine S-methyltransferase